MSAPAPSVAGRTAALDHDSVATLRRGILMLSRRMRYQQAGADMSASEAAVLGQLGKGPATPGQLARSEHVQPPSMTKIIERLENRAFLRREPDPSDRRQVLLFRTPAGDDYAERTREIRTQWLTDKLAQLSPAEQQLIGAAAEALRRLAELD